MLRTDKEYARLADEVDSIDRKTASDFDEVWDRLGFREKSHSGKEISTEEYDRLDKLMEDILDKGKIKMNRAAAKARNRAAELLSDEGVDSIRVAEDAGGFNRKTDTTVIFDPSQIKFRGDPR